MKRSPMPPRKTPLKRSAPLKQSSAPSAGETSLRRSPIKRRANGVDPTVRDAVFARDRGCVGFRLVPEARCWGPLDPHHVLRRSQGGLDTLDNLVTLCRACHSWVHEHPAASIERGLLRRST
jgi:5-methylcytosine-specific restriction endonuclease McrA